MNRSRILIITIAVLISTSIVYTLWDGSRWSARRSAIRELRREGFAYFDDRFGSDSTEVGQLNVSTETAAALCLLQPKYVVVRGWPRVTELGFLVALRKVETIDIEGCRGIRDIRGIQSLTSLRELTLTDCAVVHTVEQFSQLRSLEVLCLDNCTDLNDLHGLEQLTSLKVLYLRGCDSITSLDELPVLQQLHTVGFAGCKRLRSIRGLAQLPALRVLDLQDCKELSDVDALTHLSTLELLILTGCDRISQPEIRRLQKSLPRTSIHGQNER